MTFPQPPWPSSPPPWPSQSDHTTKELEHRLTVLEETADHHDDHHREHFETHEVHLQKLNVLERAILAVCMTLFILAQDKFPSIAAFLKGLIP